VVGGKEQVCIGRDFIYNLAADCLCAFVRSTEVYRDSGLRPRDLVYLGGLSDSYRGLRS
jgi:hypothetical protein